MKLLNVLIAAALRVRPAEDWIAASIAFIIVTAIYLSVIGCLVK